MLTVFLEWAKTETDWLGVPTDESKYWQSLDEESSTETCRMDGCTSARLKYAGLCRKHQYESRTGKPAPEPTYKRELSNDNLYLSKNRAI